MRSALYGSAGLFVSGCTQRGPGTKAPPHDPDIESRYQSLAGFCDQAPKVTNQERAQRRKAFATSMASLNQDIFVAEAGTQMNFLSGIRWGLSERPVLLVLRTDQNWWFVAPHFERRKLQAKLADLGLDDVQVHTWREHENIADILVQSLGLKDGQDKPALALDPWMRSFVAQRIREKHPPTSPGEAIVLHSRTRKTPQEIARMRLANQATKAAIQQCAQNLRWGIRQSEFAEHLRTAQRVAGLQDVWVLALFGPNASYPHGTKQDRALTKGDVVLIDTGGRLEEYQSDVSRTFRLGPVDSQVQRAYDAVFAAQDAAIAAIGPNISTGQLDATARMVFDKRGYGGSDQWFTHRLGHGIGVEVHEAPYLVAKSTTQLVPGMSFSVEPGLYFPGKFGIRIEDICVVTPNGHEVLGARMQPDEFLLRT